MSISGKRSCVDVKEVEGVLFRAWDCVCGREQELKRRGMRTLLAVYFEFRIASRWWSGTTTISTLR